MTGSKTLIQPAADEHLSAETLYRYLEGQLPPEASHQAERHLLDCNLCHEALEGLATVSSESTHHALFDLNRSIRNRSLRRKPNRLVSDLKNWALAAAILFLLVFSAVIVWYQTRLNQPVPATKATMLLETAPAPVSGWRAYQEYLRTHQQYPPAARHHLAGEKVRLQFMVNPDGTLSDIVILENPAGGFGEEAIRLLRQGPKWVPARHLGKAIRARATLEINFLPPAPSNN